MNDVHRFIATDLGLAQQHASGRASGMLDCSDDIDPELIDPDIEEEEEEEEEGDEDDPEEDPDDGDRGDDVDPDLKPEEDDDPDLELEEEEDEDEEDDLDPEALAELADGGRKAKVVPHSRFNEVNTALKAERAERLRLEEELARAKGGAGAKPEGNEEQPKPYDFDAAEDRYMDAVLDGDKEKARSIRAEIRAEERKAFEAEGAKAGKLSAAEELRQRDALVEQSSMQRVLEQAIEKYPFLDHKSKAANADAIEDVVARRDFYIRQGKSPSKALAMAVEKVAPRYDDKGGEPARKPGEKPAASEEQIRKNLGREKQIPQTPAGVGERGKDIDYSKLTDDEFDALPAEEKRKARGDFVKEA